MEAGGKLEKNGGLKTYFDALFFLFLFFMLLPFLDNSDVQARRGKGKRDPARMRGRTVIFKGSPKARKRQKLRGK